MPGCRIVERDREVVSLARTHLSPWVGWNGVELILGDMMEAISQRDALFGTVVVDCAALPALGDVPYLRRMDWEWMARTVAPGGRLVLGGLWIPPGLDGSFLAMAAEGADWIGGREGRLREVVLFTKGGGPGSGIPRGLLPEVEGKEAAALVFGKNGQEEGRTLFPGFVSRSVRPRRMGETG